MLCRPFDIKDIIVQALLQPDALCGAFLIYGLVVLAPLVDVTDLALNRFLCIYQLKALR